MTSFTCSVRPPFLDQHGLNDGFILPGYRLYLISMMRSLCLTKAHRTDISVISNSRRRQKRSVASLHMSWLGIPICPNLPDNSITVSRLFRPLSTQTNTSPLRKRERNLRSSVGPAATVRCSTSTHYEQL